MATQLRPFLTDIANAIRSKKGTSGVINAQNFASEIASIPSDGGENPLQALVSGRGANGGVYLCRNYQGQNVDFLIGIDFSSTTNMSYMFQSCTYLITIPQLNTSNVINMSNMFSSCSKLTTIPQLDTSKVIYMTNMFSSCSKLTTIPQLDTSSATSIQYMFNSCSKLTTIPQLDTSKAENCANMFFGCGKLQTIDITKLANSNNSFASYCYSLTKLIIRTMDTIPTFGIDTIYKCYHFTGTVNADYNPQGLKDGRIYVPDDKVEELKAATGWADFADIIVPLSTLVE